MATIDLSKIVSDSIDSAKKNLGKSWNKVKPFAEHEFMQFTENAVFLAKLKLSGKIEDEELKARLDIQRMALNNVLLTVKGIGLVAAQNTVNTILDIVTKVVSKALKVDLPV